MSNYCVYSSSPDSCTKRFCGTMEECEQWITDNKHRFPGYVTLRIQPDDECARWERDFDINSGNSVYEQMNDIDDKESLNDKYNNESLSTCILDEVITEEFKLRHSDYFCNLSVSEQIDVTNRAQEEIEKQTDVIFESRKFRNNVNTCPELTQLSNQDLMLFCKSLGYTVLKFKSAQERDSFIAYISNQYSRV